MFARLSHRARFKRVLALGTVVCVLLVQVAAPIEFGDRGPGEVETVGGRIDKCERSAVRTNFGYLGCSPDRLRGSNGATIFVKAPK